MLSDNRAVWLLTENTNKFREVTSILASQGIRIRHLNQPKVEIQDAKLENVAKFALQKALGRHRGLILVEDSGLFVESLNGFPGPFSSYVHKTIGSKGILGLLGPSRRRNAYFQCSLASGSSSLRPRLFTGRVHGRISRRILGDGGFGFDPIFIPNGYDQTYAETDESFKNRHSHRAIAFLKFAGWYKQAVTS